MERALEIWADEADDMKRKLHSTLFAARPTPSCGVHLSVRPSRPCSFLSRVSVLTDDIDMI